MEPAGALLEARSAARVLAWVEAREEGIGNKPGPSWSERAYQLLERLAAGMDYEDRDHFLSNKTSARDEYVVVKHEQLENRFPLTHGQKLARWANGKSVDPEDV